MTRRLAELACAALAACLLQPAFALPAIETWTTDNGARVYFVHAPEIEMIDVRLTFDGGSARDGESKGLAHITNDLLGEGAGELDADTFREALGRTGARLTTGAQRDMAYLDLRTLAAERYATPALGLLEDAIARPRFEADALERLKARAQVMFRHKQQSPGTIAEETFFAHLYADHPYASPPDGNPEAVAALTREQVVAFHRRYYVARNAVIAIVGAVDRARAEAIAARLAAAMPAGERAAALPAVAAPAAESTHVEYPSIQSHVRVGLPGMSRNDPDYFPLLVGNHALGGNSLVSLLFEEIRNKRGLSYSAYSYFQPMAEKGPFVAVLQTDRSQQDEAVAVLNQTIAAFVNDGPPAEALEAAKKNLIGGFPLRIDSNDKISEYISMIGFYDLPLDYLERFTARVAAVSADDVRDAFRRRVALDRLITVIVGRGDDPS